ncbi:hypothetical protein C2857_000371 [Epichloe festucae Fl1]|uniref:Uncharacterized protein n=1 Tax=Epichloe festucae (strain Fl1) TaxID=877507 RepID=A0A7S9PUZ6_EPIFF|nr:hypothetical protein C2857_000371 [Epichloe festucae Fl1]
MTNSNNSRGTPGEVGSPANTEGTILRAQSSPELDGNTERQDVLMPELRILEVMRTIRSGKADDTMEADLSSQANEKPSATPSPRGISGLEEAKPSSSVPRREICESQEIPKSESASTPMGLEPMSKKARKRAYQKLEEETEGYLKDWIPTWISSVKKRVSSTKPSRGQDNVESLKESKPSSKPPKAPPAPMAPMAPIMPSVVVETWDKLPKTRVEIDSALKLKSRRSDYEDVDGTTEEGAAPTEGNPELPGKRQGLRPKRGSLLRLAQKAGRDTITGPGAADKVSATEATPFKPSRPGRAKGRTVVDGRRGVIRARRGAQAAAYGKEAEGVKGKTKAHLLTLVHSGHATKPASRGGARGRGRPRKRNAI